MKFCFFALGCKVNLFESEALAQLAQARGHEIVEQGADVCVLNSCTVTAVGDHKNFRAIRRLRRDNPHAVLAVCGCMAQMEPEKLKGVADLVCGVADRAKVLDACEAFVRSRKPLDTSAFRTPPAAFEPLPPSVPRGRTRALLKIEDGCDQYCTYCIIPYARGHVRSLPMAQAVQQARQLAANGVQEIVLTGIEISSYGRERSGEDLVHLIAEICEAVPDVRIRLGSLEPRTVDDRFCALAQYPNLMPHFHLSLQSGCDTVLARMKRRYTSAQFAQKAEALRGSFPNCSITTDLIVGFPGETQAEFEQTLLFLRQCAFAAVHVFPYSPRPGTPAAAMPGQVPDLQKQCRAALAKQIASQTAQAYQEGFIGKQLRVLWEHMDADGFWRGHSPYAFQVKAKGDFCKNVFCDVTVVAVEGDCVIGQKNCKHKDR